MALRYIQQEELRETAHQLIRQDDIGALLRECANILECAREAACLWKAAELRLAAEKIEAVPEVLVET